MVRDQADDRHFIGEDFHDLGASLDLAIEPLDWVGGAELGGFLGQADDDVLGYMNFPAAANEPLAGVFAGMGHDIAHEVHAAAPPGTVHQGALDGRRSHPLAFAS
jgi:hypothetical protein